MAGSAQHELLERLRDLQERLDEAEETLRALRSGEVDAIVASGPDGERVYTLKGADEAYRVMVQGMAEGALTLSTDGLILFSNEQFATLARCPLEHVIGSRIQDFVAPEDAGRVTALLQGRDGRKAEVRLKSGGALVPAYFSVQNVILDEVERLCLIVTDLSAQKRNEEVLAMMEVVPAGVFIAEDPECRKMAGNRMAYELLRMSPPANLSKSAPEHERPKTWREMKDGRELTTEELPLQAAARTGRPVRGYEFDIVFEDGEVRTWLGSAVPLFDEAGRPRGSVGAFVDITERRIAGERLLQTQKLESIGVLAGGIAHDFNNLLVGVVGNASLAQELIPPGNRAGELLRGVIKTGEQLANLTRQMLAYSGKGQFFLERLDLSELVPEMSALIQPSIPKKIALHFELERGLPPIEADRGQMQQVLMNLVLNAAEAIGSNAGLISITTGAQSVDESYLRLNPDAAGLSPGDYVYLEVRDTGCGIDPALKAKIFDPFFTTKFMGRGLGLAAVSGIVRGHKGAINVTTMPGKGTCFTVLFPAAPGAAVERAASDLTAADRGTGTILVVDDEEVVREMARNALGHHGFDVLAAASGVEAIDIFKRHPGEIALVVLDLSMPGLGGEEVLPQLRRIRPSVKVIVSSGYSEPESMALFRGQRVSGFIQKPYTSSRLAQRVKAALE
ncbi:MAG TPA: ATP-binding protein [Bryobacteraceae bacterium]|nr:ATP-binding protein [Bryobacteraceae bacterium]